MTLVKQCQLLGNIFSVLKINTCLTVTGNGNFIAAMTIGANEDIHAVFLRQRSEVVHVVTCKRLTKSWTFFGRHVRLLYYNPKAALCLSWCLRFRQQSGCNRPQTVNRTTTKSYV